MPAGRSFWVIAGATLAVALVACGGGRGDSCRSTGDCSDNLYCAGPNDPPVCGIGPREGCASDADCFGQVCHGIFDPCSPDGIGSECGPPCTTCETGFRCNAAGACEPVPCDEGFACQVYQQCDTALAHASGPVHGRSQGCVAIACARDSECPAGTACTNEVCQSGPGTCREVQLVP